MPTERRGTAAARRRARILRRLLIVLGLYFGLGMSAAAWAYWGSSVNPGASGVATAASVNQGATPSVSPTAGRTVTVTWGASTLDNGRPVDGYIVRRYDAGTSASQTVLGGCAGTVTATNCVESPVPPGQWRYTVTPVIGANWQGAESAKSGTALVASATLTLARTVFGAPLPQGTTGSLAGFAPAEGISYRMDASTGLTGSPSAAAASGNATITALTIPTTADGSHTVHTFGDATPVASHASVGIVVDTAPPTVTATLNPTPNGASWNNSSPVQVTLTATDGSGSGVNQIRYTTDGTDPTASGTAATYSAPIQLTSSKTVRYYATDLAGNASAVATQAVNVDTVAPSNSLALSNVTGNAVKSGATVYYRGAASGSFTLTNSLADTGGSGPATSGTAALSGTSTGWAHTSSSVGSPYVSNPFSWSAGTTTAPSETVTGADAAGNTTSTTLTYVDDSMGPAGGSVDAIGLVGTGSRYSTSTTLNIAFAKGTDAGSGLAASGAKLYRATATLANGTCGAYGAYAQTGATDAASPISDPVADQACYSYLYTVADVLGDTTTYQSGDVKVDTTAPSHSPALSNVTGNAVKSGATVYYRGTAAGSFTLTNTVTDTVAGPGSSRTASLSGTSTGWSHTPSTVSTPAAGPYVSNPFTWTPGTTTSPTETITAANAAGSTASTTLTYVNDSTGPAGGSVDATGLVGTGSRYSTSTTLNIAFAKGTDAGAGLTATGAQLQRATATLTNGTCGSFGSYTLVGTDLTSPTADTVADGACYRYQYVVADSVANATTYTSGDIKVDTTAPTAPSLSFSSFANAYASGTTVYYRSNAASGSFTTTASSTDAVAGIASYTFPALGTNWASTPGSVGVNTYSWSGAPAAPGSPTVTATNNAGTSSPATSFTMTADTTAPSPVSVTYANDVITAGSISVSFSAGTDGGSGVDTAAGLLQRSTAPYTLNACGTYGALTTIATGPTSPFTDSTATTGYCYKYQYIAFDNVGNQATSAANANVARLDYTTAVTNTAGLVSYWRMGANPSPADTFSGATGGELSTHTADTGGAWIKHNDASVVGTAVISGGNQVRKNGAKNAWYYNNTAPPSADYAVEADVTLKSAKSDDYVCVLGRNDGTIAKWYEACYADSTGSWELWKAGVSAPAQIGTSSAQALTIGQAYRLRLEMVGSTISLWVDGSAKISVADTSFTVAGYGGIQLGANGATAAPTDTTGWQLDNWRIVPNTGTAVTDSKGTNNGTFTGTPLLNVEGALTNDFNTAVQFSASTQYASVPHNTTLNLGDVFTVEAWVQRRDYATGTQVILNKGTNAYKLAFVSNQLTLMKDGVGNIVQSSAALADDRVNFHHYVATKNGATVKLYRDGVDVTGTVANKTTADSSTALYIGSKNGSTEALNGVVDEVALYNQAISATSVGEHYRLGKGI